VILDDTHHPPPTLDATRQLAESGKATAEYFDRKLSGRAAASVQ
jgi:hypothetical protein